MDLGTQPSEWQGQEEPCRGIWGPIPPALTQGRGGMEPRSGEECRLEPSGSLTCAPALRLQGIARIELLKEGVTMFPADDAAGEETGLFMGEQHAGEAPPGPLDLGDAYFLHSLSPEHPQVLLYTGHHLDAFGATLLTEPIPFLGFNLRW